MSDWSKKLEAAMIIAPSVVGGLMASEPIQIPDISTNEPGYSQLQEQQPNSCSLDEKPETSEAQQEYESLPAIARVPSLDSQLENSYSDTGFGSKDSAADNQPTISGPPNADNFKETDVSPDRQIIPRPDSQLSTEVANVPGNQQNDNAELANQLRSETFSPSPQTESQEVNGDSGNIA